MWFLNITSWQDLVINLAVRIFIILGILPLHELAHGWMARKLGDNTAYEQGRLTLNPMAHIDWLGAAAIILIGFGWAKPVPVNPMRFRDQKNRKRGMALTALAGPVSNLIAALVAGLILRIICCFPISGDATYYIVMVFYSIISINVGLAVFNLIPIHPLDGSRILGWLLPDRWLYALERNSRYFMIGIMVLVFSGLLDKPLYFMREGIIDGIFGLWNLLFRIFGL